MNDHTPEPIDENAVSRGHEVIETNVSLVIKFGIGLTAMAVISMLLMWGMFVAVEDFNEASFDTPSPLLDQTQLPPAPRLQVIPEEDLAIFREIEEKKLNSYGWVIRTADIVQIPIDRAMQLTADEDRFKLSARPESLNEGQ
jgi:hypothetical protein